MDFNQIDIKKLQDIMSARRDVRGNKFIDKKITEQILRAILESANSAPSVGFSQPWRFVIIQDEEVRSKIYKSFVVENEKAKKIFNSERYNSLKLEGIKESDLNIAVFYKKPKKDILGQTSQKKMGEYSVVCAIQNMWLMARAYGIGIGWISLLKPKKVKKILNMGKEHKLIAYLALGYVSEFLDEPELKLLKWEEKKEVDDIIEKWI